MPYKIIPHGQGKYTVKNVESGKVAAKSTTKTKAEAQVRLLNYLRGKEKK
jgi:hypothetical protein